MSRIQPVVPESASSKAQALLAGVNRKLGFTPNLMATLGQSGAALEGYLGFSGALAQGRLDAKLREQLALVVAQVNDCQYCLAAHTAIGKMAGLSEGEIAESRKAASADTRTGVALRFAQEIVIRRGEVDDAVLRRVREAGFTDAEIVEIVANVALNIFTNYINHVAGTEIDFPKVETTVSG